MARVRGSWVIRVSCTHVRSECRDLDFRRLQVIIIVGEPVSELTVTQGLLADGYRFRDYGLNHYTKRSN